MENELIEAGLSKGEANVYLSLLREGPIGGGDLAKVLNIDRTHAYNILRNLVNKGLASQVVKEKKTHFSAVSPKNLLNNIRKKELAIKSIIPRLELLEKIKRNHMSVRVLEGKEGMRTLLNELIESKSKEILVYGGTGKSYEILEYEVPHFAKKTLLNKMNGRIITSEKLKDKPFTKLPNFKIKYVPYTTSSSTIIFGDNVSINVFDEGPSFILINSKSVASSYKEYFNLLWTN